LLYQAWWRKRRVEREDGAMELKSLRNTGVTGAQCQEITNKVKVDLS